jgi:tetratricopeptide (TPR) repeat protein
MNNKPASGADMSRVKKNLLVWGLILLAAAGCRSAPAARETDEVLEGIRSLYRNHEKYADAVELVTKSIERFPKDDRLYYLRGFCYLHEGDTEKALEDYSVCVNINPKNADGYKGLGSIYADKELYDLAEKNFNRAVELAANDERKAVYYVDLADLYASKGDKKRAVEYINQAIALHDISDYYYHWGVYLGDDKQYAEAEAAWLAGIAKNSFRQIEFKHYIFVGLSALCYLLEKHQEAEAYIERALELSPDNKGYLEALKQIQTGMGN